MTPKQHMEIHEIAAGRSLTDAEKTKVSAIYAADPRLQKSKGQEFALPGIPGRLVIEDDGKWTHTTPDGSAISGDSTDDFKTLRDYLQRQSASQRPTNTQRDVRTTEKRMSDRIEKSTGEGLFRNLIIGPEPEPVAKAAVREFMPGEGETEIDDVAAALARWAGQSEDATRSSENPAAPNFRAGTVPMAADGTTVSPFEPYDVTSGGTLAPEYMPAQFLPVDADGNIVEPADYSPSQPASRPVGADAVDFDDTADANEDLFDSADDDFDEAGEPTTKRIGGADPWLSKDETAAKKPAAAAMPMTPKRKARRGMKMGTASYTLKSQITGA